MSCQRLPNVVSAPLRSIPIVAMALLAVLFVTPALQAQEGPSYFFTPIAPINAAGYGTPAVNSRGFVGFVGRTARDGKIYENLYLYDPNALTTSPLMNSIFEYPNAGASPTQEFSDWVAVNENNEVIAHRRLNAIALSPCSIIGGVQSTVPLTYIEKWAAGDPLPQQLFMADALLQKSLSCILNPVTAGTYPSPLDTSQPFQAAHKFFSPNSSDQIAFGALQNYNNLRVTGPHAGAYPWLGGSTPGLVIKPSMANSGDYVFTTVGASNANGNVFAESFDFKSLRLIAGAPDFAAVGSQAAISKTGKVIVFWADLTDSGAQKLNLAPGPGIYAYLITGAGFQGRFARLDIHKTPVLGTIDTTNECTYALWQTSGCEVLGKDDNDVPNTFTFDSADQNGVVNILHKELGTVGFDEDSIIVTFTATPTGDNAINHITWGNRGAWSIIASLRLDSNSQIGLDLGVTNLIAQADEITITDIVMGRGLSGGVQSPSIHGVSMLINTPTGPSIEVAEYCGIGRPQLVDPITLPPSTDSLLSGDRITNDFSKLFRFGRPVGGIAADGVTQVLVRFPMTGPKQRVKIRICTNDPTVPPFQCNESSSIDDMNKYGGIADPIAASSTFIWSDLSIASSQVTPDNFWGFFAYRAPLDFATQSSVAVDGSQIRIVHVIFEILMPGAKSTFRYLAIPVVRPPVILVHGLWDDMSGWVASEGNLGFDGFIKNKKYPLVFRSNYGAKISSFRDKANNPFQIDDDHSDPNRLLYKSEALGSALGFEHGAQRLTEEIKTAIDQYRYKIKLPGWHVGIAAAQVDLVGHSMGGMVSRQVAELPGYKNDQNYNQGYIHKLVTMATPHLGSCVANHMGQPQGWQENACVMELFSHQGMHPYTSVTIPGYSNKLMHGAMLDLQGADCFRPADRYSATLKLNKAGQKIPTAMIVAQLVNLQVAALDRSATVADMIRKACFPSDITQYIHGDWINGHNWNELLGGPNNRHSTSDGIVEVTSAANGRPLSGDPSVVRISGKIHGLGVSMLGFNNADPQMIWVNRLWLKWPMVLYRSQYPRQDIRTPDVIDDVELMLDQPVWDVHYKPIAP